MDVFFYEAFEEEEKKLKYFLPDHIKAGFTRETIQEYNHSEPPASLISIRTQSQIPEKWSSALSGILSRSTGYDHLTKYQADNVPSLACGYLPLYCHRAVAEQALLMWLTLMRKLPQQLAQFNSFHRDGITGREVEGKNLAVVGVGNIGYEIVKLGKGLGMNVIGVDIAHNHHDVMYQSIEEAISVADVIVCAMNLTQDNTAFFNYERLKDAKKRVIFINISRGELSPSLDLLALLEEEKIGGVGLDVFNEEKLLAQALRAKKNIQNPEINATLSLSRHPKAICTPHNAFNSEEGVVRKSEQSVQQILYFIQEGKFIWSVFP